VQLDAEILLGILPDCLYQALRFFQHLIGVVVERLVLEELSRRPPARLKIAGQRSKLGHRGVDLLRQFLVLQQPSRRPLALLQVVAHLF